VAGLGWGRGLIGGLTQTNRLAGTNRRRRPGRPRQASLQADRAKHHLQFAGDSRAGSKLLANVVSEIAIRLIRLNDLMRVTG